eukprot:gnl/MRDRNA2_/MRDRNA2_35142_c0_seq1.p1 gnl/MRDRNA2_/MRDRNA2_35142_c0~~gnl/MRDRNA2_/MRDRNA2_35142_c0_seq1.p1  ORF type:complete len:494 (+),score=78.79 gnl/MRDRNA2_/MRDRNA2_35142_c0_seq1:143-1624(+)
MANLYESFYTMFTGLYNNVDNNPPPPGKQQADPKKGGAPHSNGYPNGAGYQAHGAPPPGASPQAARPNGALNGPSGSPGTHQGAPQGGMRGMSPQPSMRNGDVDRNAPVNQSPMGNRNQGGWEAEKGSAGYGQDPHKAPGGYGQDPNKGGYGQDPNGSAMRTPERRPGGYENGGGMSSTATPGVPPPYTADKEDLLDQHVAYYLRHHPDVHRRHHLVRKRPGVYELNGREVLVEWQYATEPGGQGHLVVLDGPLRQPFSDYMEFSELNAEYDNQSVGTRSSLHMIPKDKRMSFGDQHKVYTRLEAMKVAKEQALVRETHADYVKEGRHAPNDLMDKYKKTLSQKLGPYRRSAPTPESPPSNPPPSNPAPSNPAQPVGNGPAKPGPQPQTQQQHQPTPAMPNPTSTPAPAPRHTTAAPAAAPAPAPAAAQPYGMQPHSWAPPYQTSGTTTAIPQYNPTPGALAPPQGLFQQNMGGHNSYRPPSTQHQAYPMRWG